MSKLNELVLSICEEYERGRSTKQIAKKYNLTIQEVYQILKDFYGELVRER